MARILLLTGFSPDVQYGGGPVVRSLVDRFDPENIGWVCLWTPKKGGLSARIERVMAGQYAFRPFGSNRLRLGWIWDHYYQRVWSKLAAKKVASTCLQYDAETLWIVLDYHIVPVAAELVRRRAARRFHFSIHDHPIDMARWHIRSPSLIAAIEDGFGLIKNSN